jgi:triosephosphate isomerase
MNTDGASATALARSISEQSPGYGAVDLLVCPPLCYLKTVSSALAGGTVTCGAQNMYWEKNGAFTGEVSAAMLLDCGATFVILGHSERRHLMGETDEMVNKKTLAAHAAGHTPIESVGELLNEPEAGKTSQVIRRQFEGSLAGLSTDLMAATVIAYEPVWAIGTGKVATPDQAEEVHADLRKLIGDRYNVETADRVRILYGGSVKPDNAADLLGKPNVDGALVGGASLKAEDFMAIAAAGTLLAPDDPERPAGD